MKLRELIVTFLIAGCAAAGDPPAGRQPEPARTRAALATINVDNRTNQRLTILYTLSTRATSSVTIGHVDSAAVAAMAPVPAGEPLIMTARNPRGDVLILPPRTFEIDGVWNWLIAADARFVAPPARVR
jgi:hypothetical protein